MPKDTLIGYTGAPHVPDRHCDEVVLSVEDLSVSYTIYEDRRVSLGRLFRQKFRRRSVRRIEAVRGVTLDFYEGETVGVVGPNGSGKSTLLRAMTGLIAPQTGVVQSRSLPVMLGVSAALNQDLSGRRNVILGGTAMGLSRRQIEFRAEEILEFAGLSNFSDVPVRAYSRGMRSRLQFSIAAAVEPDILFIDEALAVGDKSFQDRSGTRIKELSARAGLVVIVSHSMVSLREVCHRVVWIEAGCVVADGPTEDVLSSYESS